ncbi:outer membrane lipoprotein-sorting protein [Spirochaeta cellobiosiphila]|uniref:outer membrane lipoprotein-sorting protein n=1 Tax=Spirochaeta cellobiosiphila TaxID=504483 RepID=UPI000410F5FB|nr:outer membrane lipoprotein-sorting protein [Spirochaeta cellobiosiphila]
MKKFFLISSLLIASQFAFAQQSAEQIIDASRNRIDAKTTSTRSTMILTAKDGSTTERMIDEYTSDAKDGSNRGVIMFQKPASVAGTRFLTLEVKDGDDNKWIYLPALGKVRRISSSEGSSSFVGTDFSYDDLSALDRDVNKDTHTLLGSDSLDGNDCWLIQSVPKESYQYAKVKIWVDKNTKATRKMELYDDKGDMVKLFQVLKFETVQGWVTPMEMKMTTIKSNTSTTIKVDIIKYDQPIPDAVFTTNYLATGRAR